MGFAASPRLIKEGNFTHTTSGNILTSQPSRGSLLRRVLYRFLKIVAIIAIILGSKVLYRVIWRSITTPKVIDSIHTTFPNFCKHGQVLADTHIDVLETIMTGYDNHFWFISCDSWARYSTEIPVVATFVNLNTCMTMDPIFYNKNSEYAAEVQAMSGQKLAFCP